MTQTITESATYLAEGLDIHRGKAKLFLMRYMNGPVHIDDAHVEVLVHDLVMAYTAYHTDKDNT